MASKLLHDSMDAKRIVLNTTPVLIYRKRQKPEIGKLRPMPRSGPGLQGTLCQEAGFRNGMLPLQITLQRIQQLALLVIQMISHGA